MQYEDPGQGVDRVTVSLPKALARRLRWRARAKGASVSSVVRAALEKELDEEPRLPSFVGIGRSGHTDTAERAEEIIREHVARDGRL